MGTASSRMVAAAILSLLVAGCAGSEPRPPVGRGPGGIEVHQLELSASNVFLVKARAPVLVDAGSPDDLEDLEEALRALGVALRDVKLAILTHGHGDHAALGSAYRKAGIPLAMGRGDLPMAEAGRNDDLKPTSFFARVLKPFIDYRYAPFAPDILLDEKGLDLRPYGIAGQAFQMPGHTPGSVVVLLEDRSAFVGDMMLGGSLGGAISPASPGEHYYQADLAKNRENLEALLRRGVERFYLGHGGPVTREAVIEGFELDPKAVAPAR